jgi:hypothetical protein
MPIILDNTSITGLGVGGLPVSTVNSTTLADAAVISSKLANNSILASKIDIPYQMVVRTTGYTVPSGTTNIDYNVLREARLTSHNSSINMLFQVPGKYLITTGWRFGSGGDVWTGVRILDEDGTVRGRGYGTGQLNENDAGPCEITFIADIPASRINQNMRMQFMRLGSTMGIASPGIESADAIVTTVVWCGV